MNRKHLKYKIALILGVIGLSSWLIYPLNKKINLGLDLRGGMHLVLRVDTQGLSADSKSDAVERAIEVIRNRIDEFGVAEPLIQRQGLDQIVVQLPGVTDRIRAKELIGKTALLEFKLVNDKPDDLAKASAGTVPEGFDYLKDDNDRPILISKTASLTGEGIKNAFVDMDQMGLPVVKLEFNEKGIDSFAQVTGAHINERLAIVLDGKIHSAPVIRSKIDSGKAEITGRFDTQEANDLKIVLRSGALPAPMEVEEERTIGPLLGGDSIRSGIKASIIGGILVFLFMLIYYLLSGIIASLALILNFLIILGFLAYFHATLTLPGIAGIVLTLGMAVDANVLINERIREELKLGKTLFNAITNGYSKAFSAILDSNITTLIAAFFLFQFGTGPIRGFALTLSVGLVASMFTAIFVTRAILESILALNKKFNRLPMLQFFGETKFDFIGKRRFFYAISSILIIVGLLAFFKNGKNAYGIDFAGGQIQEYRFASPVSTEQVRAALSGIGFSEVSIQRFKEDSRIVMIRTPQDTSEVVAQKFKEGFPGNPFDVLRV